MSVERYTIDSEDEARTYLTDLLRDPTKRSVSEIERHCDLHVTDPGIRAFFLAEGTRMAAEMEE